MDKQAFYNEQLEFLAVKNPNGLVESHYSDDAEMIILSGETPLIVKGKEELKKLFDGYITYVYRGFLSTEKFVTTDDSIVFEATINTVNGPLKVYDSMFLKDGKIFRHYSGAK